MGGGTGRGREIKKEYNLVRVIHRVWSKHRAHLIRSIDRSIESNRAKTQKRRKTRRARIEFLTSYEDGIARATCSHMYPRTTTGRAGEIAALTIHSASSPALNGTGQRIFLVNIYPYSSEEIDPHRPGSQRRYQKGRLYRSPLSPSLPKQ